MKLWQDIKEMKLSRFLGLVAVGVSFWCILGKYPEYLVSASTYLVLIVWGVVGGNSAIGRMKSGPGDPEK